MVRDKAPSDQRNRRIARLGAALTVAALALGLSPARAADDPFLSRLAGEWIGNGTVKLSPKAEAERIYCRIVSTLVAGNSIEQKGRCSVASNSGALASTISARGGGRYEGVMSAPTVGSANFKGNGSGNRLTLSANFVDSKTQQQRKATVTMSLSGSGYRVTTSNSGEGTNYVASDITFKKK